MGTQQASPKNTGVAVVVGTSNTKWDITVNTGTGDGTITLGFVSATGLNLSVSTSMPYSGQFYTIDKKAPATPEIQARFQIKIRSPSPRRRPIR